MANVRSDNVKGVVSLLTVQLMIQSLLITIVFNVRDVWFLSYFPASALTWAQLAVAAFTSRSGLFMKSGNYWGRIKSIQVLYCYGAVFFGVLAVGYNTHPPTAAFIIYVASDVMIQIMVSIFWDICAEIFDVQQSKRLFGIINSGSLFGSAFCGFFFIPFIKANGFTKQNILVMLSGAMLFSALCWYATGIILTRKGIYVIQRRKSISGSGKGVVDENSDLAWSRRYYVFMCLLEMFSNLARVMVDLLMAVKLSDFDTGSRAILLGQVSGLQSLIMVPFMLSAYWAVQSLGVLPCYGVAPISVLIFAFGTFDGVGEDNTPFVFGRAFFNAVNYTWFNTGRELLFLPVHRSDIDVLKPYVQGRLRAVVKVFGCFLCTIMQYFDSEPSTLTIVLITIAIAWGVLCVVTLQPYRQEFWDSLHRGRLVSLDEDSMYITSQAVDVVRHVLKNRPNQKVSQAEIKQTEDIPEELDSMLLNNLSTSPIAVDSRIRLIIHSLPPHMAHIFRDEVRDLFFKSVTQPSESLHLPLRMRILHLEREQGNSEVLFTCTELLAIASFEQVPIEVRCHSVLAVGDKATNSRLDLGHKRRLEALMRQSNPMSLRIASAIALLKRTKMRHAAAHCRLQKVMHGDLSTLDDHAAQGLLMIGQELPEYLADGYLLYLLEVGNDAQKMVAIKICRQDHQRSSILVPHLVQCLLLGRYPALCADALILSKQGIQKIAYFTFFFHF